MSIAHKNLLCQCTAMLCDSMGSSMAKLPDCKRILLFFSFDYMQERRELLLALLTEKRTEGRKRRVGRGVLLYFKPPKSNHLEYMLFQLLSPTVTEWLAHWEKPSWENDGHWSPVAVPPVKLCALHTASGTLCWSSGDVNELTAPFSLLLEFWDSC